MSEETKRRPRAAADATYQQVKYESVLAQRDALSARVAELEAVVRAADAMRALPLMYDRLDCQETFDAYDAARAKIEVPRG